MTEPNRRVRAVLLTAEAEILLLKRLRPGVPEPYWVAPGGGIEPDDVSVEAALHREVAEEIGGVIDILRPALVLAEVMGEETISQLYYLCHLRRYDFDRRNGPELTDPTRGAHIPEFYPLEVAALAGLNIKNPEFKAWLLANLAQLRDESARFA